MEFTKQFAEAAQNAVLRKIEADQWENLPWLAKLVQQVVRDGVAAAVISSDATIKPLDLADWNTPVDICGCPFGKCTCANERLEKLPEAISRVAQKHKIDPAVLAVMAKVESSENKQPIGGFVETAEGVFRAGADSFESNDFAHVDGYDWQIVAIDRWKNSFNSWAVHFSRMPTKEEFEKQFKHFEDRTHYVHVNEWRGGKWVSITEEYTGKKVKPEEAKETFTTTEEWPLGKTHRIKFWDQRVNAYNYVYFDRHPGGIVLHKYHSTKCYAVVQKRPEGV